jgi:sulfur-oxidizing protein SoxY
MILPHPRIRTGKAGFKPFYRPLTTDLAKELSMQSRRDLLTHGAAVAALLAGAGLLPAAAQAAYSTAAFDAKSMAEVLKALGGAAPTESKDVTLTAPDIAENGAVVPLACSTTLPGVKRMLLMVEKNPSALSALFDVSDAIDANFSTRVKMGQSSNVYAVAMMADGRALFAQKEVKVTLGGCGG